MSTASVRRLGLAITSAAVALATCALGAGPASAADDVIASSTSNVVASSPSNAGAGRTKVVATASLPRGIVVTNHGGASVGLFTHGEQDRRKPRPGVAPATFTGLTPGRTYTVTLNEKVVGHATALDRPAPASALVVRTTDLPDSVNLTWKQKQSTATGGKAIAYDISAKDSKKPTTKPITVSVVGKHAATLKGLDPMALYTFTVTPRNTAGKGKPASASMTRSLFEITGKGAPVAETAKPEAPRPEAPKVVTPVVEPSAATSAPSTPSAPSAPSAPSPPSAPSTPIRPATKIIYLCPEGFTDNGSTCSKTSPYTYTTQAYTFHQEQTGTTPTWIGSCDAVRTVWDGFSNNVEHYSYPCVQGGLPIYSQVKDATPSGYEDTGSNWRKKDAPPAGWGDNGSAYEQTAAKVAHEVLA